MSNLEFLVINAETIKKFLSSRSREVGDIIANTYLSHAKLKTINPDSYFLRLNNNNRIIALPAHVRDINVSGIKWIASYPDNIKNNLPRASAVLLLNDGDSGYPFACLEGSVISATRTAASAVLAATLINKNVKHIENIGFIGCGLISSYIYKHFKDNEWKFNKILLHDMDKNRAINFSFNLNNESIVEITDSAYSLIEKSDIIVFATTASEPYIERLPKDANKIILHISLRDISPQEILKSINIVDDEKHIMKANTSIHLTKQESNRNDLELLSISDLIDGTHTINDKRNIIFSPFGLGCLDLALGFYIYENTRNTEQVLCVNNFFDLSL